MSLPRTPLSLTSYLVDQAQGLTGEGLNRIVVLTLRSEGRELCVCMSRVDAIVLASQLSNAAGPGIGGGE